MKTLFKLTLGLALTLFMAVAIASVTDASPLEATQVILSIGAVVWAVRIVLISTLNDPSRIQRAHGIMPLIAVEFWESVIASTLFKNYDWVTRAKNRTQYVLNNAVVHIPQAGSVIGSVRNRANYPVPVNRRVDFDITYPLDEISTDNTHIKDAEKIELSYAKILDVFGDHINVLSKNSAANALYRWMSAPGNQSALPAANIVRTTGAATATYLTGATGNRNKFMVADVASAKTILIKQCAQERNVGRRALIMTEDAYQQLKSDTVLTTLYNLPVVGAVFDNGDLTQIHGFDIIRTDAMIRFNNAGVPLAKDPLDPTVTNAATDNDVMLLVDFDKVHIAKGAIEMFANVKDANYQGDVYSALIRIGASRERNDNAGVVAIVQQ